MAVCGALSLDITFDCDNQVVAGTIPRVWLIDKTTVDSVTVGANASIASAIVFAVGGEALVYEGFRNSVNPESAFIPTTLTAGYDHQLAIQVYKIDSLTKLELEKLSLNKIMALVENVNTPGNGDSVFELFGADAGMEMLTLTRLNRDQESGGTYSVVLKTSDESGKEPKLPLSFFDTDYATTLAKIITYETPAV